MQPPDGPTSPRGLRVPGGVRWAISVAYAGQGVCLAALVTAQGRPLTLKASVLPYESLAGTAGRADDARWLRRHVRSPGWRVLVPRARASALSKSPPPGVSLQRVRSGLLVGADAPTPFAMTATEAMETWLLPVSAP